MTSTDSRVTSQLLKRKSGEFDLESIFILDLQKLDLDDLGNIGECTTLDKLNLSKNRIQKLYALSSLLNLTWLDLSANMIQYVDGLQTLEKLKSLNLAGNLIQNIESLNCLFGLEQLDSLRLKDSVLEISNPVCASCTYKYQISQNLPQLKELDGERLSGKGSELFDLLNSLNDNMNDSRPKSSGGLYRDSPLDGITPEYFRVEANEFEDEVETLDAEKELLELLADCRQLQRRDVHDPAATT